MINRKIFYKSGPWLRSTMTQMRLNSVAVCHIHQQLLGEVDLTQLMR